MAPLDPSQPPPPSLALLPPAQLRAIRSNLLTEHFRWSPESFAKSAMDLANVVVYMAIDTAEESLTARDDLFDLEEVQAGIYRLETLLESAVDKQFDLYEIYVLRNTFSVPDALIPYIVLSHQETLLNPAPISDEQALQAYKDEVAAYECALEDRRKLEAARAWSEQLLEDQTALAHEIGALATAGGLHPSATSLAAQLAALQTSLLSLLSTPVPSIAQHLPKSGSAKDDEDPFAGSRSAFVNWAASEKVKNLPVAGSGNDARAAPVGDGVGSSDEAAALLAKIAQTIVQNKDVTDLQQLEELWEDAEVYRDQIDHQAHHLSSLAHQNLIIPVDIRAHPLDAPDRDRRKLVNALSRKAQGAVEQSKSSRFMNGPEPSWVVNPEKRLHRHTENCGH